MKALELIEVGEEIGIIFPEELCKNLQVSLGDEVHLTPTENGFALHSNESDKKFFFQRREEPL
jgi:antitoxin component of MazEF toxin-antitoxin module